VKSSFFSQSSLCVYIYCDLSSCAQSVNKLLYVGEKKEEEAQKVCPKPEASKCVLVRKNRKSTHASNLSFHLSFRQLLCVRLSLRTGLVFFPFFAYSKKTSFRTRNSSFLKHRIHPKHGSGRTSSLTRSNTRKCVVVVLLCLLLCRVLL
jgi:hypothetical protein